MGVGVGVSSGEGLLCGRGDLGPAWGRVMLSSHADCTLTQSPELNSGGGKLMHGVYADAQDQVQRQGILCLIQTGMAPWMPSLEPDAHGSLLAACLRQAWSGAGCYAALCPNGAQL